MFALPRKTSSWFLSKIFVVRNSPIKLLRFHLADGTQQVAIYHQSCFECAFPTPFSLSSKLAKVTVTSSYCFQNTLSRAACTPVWLSYNTAGWGPQSSSQMSGCSSREVIEHPESSVAIEKPRELTVYPTSTCFFSENEMASRMFSMSISLLHHPLQRERTR